MLLKAKLASIKEEDIVSELNELLKTAKVMISYTGQRLLKVPNYEGEVTINELAETFFKAPALRPKNSPDLADRLACDDMWTKIQNLYVKSEKKLGKTSSLLQTFTHFREFRPYCRACSGDPQAIIGEWDFGGQRSNLFEFKPEEFKSLFGNKGNVGKSWSADGEYWLATREMVEEAYQKQTDRLSNTMRP